MMESSSAKIWRVANGSLALKMALRTNVMILQMMTTHLSMTSCSRTWSAQLKLSVNYIHSYFQTHISRVIIKIMLCNANTSSPMGQLPQKMQNDHHLQP